MSRLAMSLTPVQQGMLFHHVSDEHRARGVEVLQVAGPVENGLDLTRLREAWAAVAARHGALRTTFEWGDDEPPRQIVHDEVTIEFRVEDVEDVETRFRSLLDEDRLRGFDIAAAPPWRVQIVRSRDETRMLWTHHHIILDGRSERIVLREVFAHYDGGPTELDPAPTRFAEHVAWHEARDAGASDAFWRDRLEGAESSPLPPEDGPDAVERPGPGEVEVSLTRAESDALRRVATRSDATLETVSLAAWAVVLSRYGRTDDVVYGCVRAGRYTIKGAKDVVGTMINAVPVRARLEPGESVAGLVRRLRADSLATRPHEHVAPVRLRELAGLAGGRPLYRSIVIYDDYLLERELPRLGPSWQDRALRLIDHTSLPLALYVHGEDRIFIRLAYDRELFTHDAIERMTGAYVAVLRAFAANESTHVGDIGLADAGELAVHETHPAMAPLAATTIDDAFFACADRCADRIAVICGDDERTWHRVAADVRDLARRLVEAGVRAGDRVGIAVERSADLVTALLGTLAAGTAYVPLDPEYPAERLGLMIEDSGLKVAVVGRHVTGFLPRGIARVPAASDGLADVGPLAADHGADALAYLLYTSGSTGRPKGVRVTHANVTSFFEAMDDRIGDLDGGRWLAVTSISFDISVLELLHTLTRGCTVVIEGGDAPAAAASSSRLTPDLGLFYFAGREGNEGDAYRLLLDGARFGDANGFTSVWTPERHFHAFGGLYPNPSVTGAAIAAITERIGIRAGSVVMPLQDPLRVAEEWAVVDRLSGGRVGLSFASGWHAGDFVLAPDAYDDRFTNLYTGIDTVRRLWRGESITRVDGAGTETEVRVFPRPVQAELPIWVTSAGNVETFRSAGRIGASLLTHLLGQDVTALGERLRAYREARREAGHAGDGHVTLMIHAFVGADDESARETARTPFIDYLRTSSGLVRALARSLGQDDDVDEATLDRFLEQRYDRYASANGLIGGPETCRAMLADLADLGVDEAACLIDFGIADDAVLESLPRLAALRSDAVSVTTTATVSELIARHDVTHLQCTPSAARLIAAEDGGLEALARLELMMVGGEALDGDLANRLTTALPGRVMNMYGPTETTIWSATAPVEPMPIGRVAPIGRAIARTDIRILDHLGHHVPRGVPGEIVIGGPGVTDGYHGLADLTAERFPLDREGRRLYRTGDLGRIRGDGALEFMGRVDNQVKIRGHRIELEEVEAHLASHPDVSAAGARALVDASGAATLVGYVVSDVRLDVIEFRAFLAGRLPDAMIPTAIVTLDALPLTPNGKLDRKALPEPRAAADRRVRAPSTPTEEALVEMWQRVLGHDRVGADDDFFQLGGHSLLAVQLASEIQRSMGVSVPMSRLFDRPRLSDLAATIDEDLIANATDDALERALSELEDLGD